MIDKNKIKYCSEVDFLFLLLMHPLNMCVIKINTLQKSFFLYYLSLSTLDSFLVLFWLVSRGEGATLFLFELTDFVWILHMIYYSLLKCV